MYQPYFEISKYEKIDTLILLKLYEIRLPFYNNTPAPITLVKMNENKTRTLY